MNKTLYNLYIKITKDKTKVYARRFPMIDNTIFCLFPNIDFFWSIKKILKLYHIFLARGESQLITCDYTRQIMFSQAFQFMACVVNDVGPLFLGPGSTRILEINRR
jgi:hypothetical protein